MKEIIKFSIMIVSTGLVLCQLANGMAAEVNEYADKIAFLRNGEVWIIDKDGQGIEQVTETTGIVEEFLFSPTFKYLAYSKIIDYVDEPGLWEEDEKVAQRAVCSIVIMALHDEKIVKEIMPPEHNWIYPSKWLPGDKLFYYAASGFDVWGFFEYDIQKGIEGELDYNKARVILDSVFHKDGSLVTYTNNSKVGNEFKDNLHIVDLNSNDDKIIVSRKSILEPAISCDKRQVAFVEVERVENEYFDNLWICNVESGSLEKLYRGPGKGKSGGVSELSWSFDDRHIGIFISPEALVLEIQDPDNIHKLRGTDYYWIGNKVIVFALGNDIYLYNLDTRKRELFLENASNPVFLWKKK